MEMVPNASIIRIHVLAEGGLNVIDNLQFIDLNWLIVEQQRG